MLLEEEEEEEEEEEYDRSVFLSGEEEAVVEHILVK
jgi:hypothetical protein